MDEKNHEEVKNSVLEFVKALFEELEEEMAMSHQEKYALLEDAFENAADVSELKIAFEQWYADHSEELDFEHEAEELWDQAISQMEE
ncbi:MAG: hypothetical protein A2469_03575 [Candidatus Magasanikbacteria bacterium RIFOXYC2_FULL_40_16]|uniref:Uncharacterized protein n=3 Tax=Candidatus Magasanikiibacteriota TaxID=1752731 RepID=A0A1F6NDQ8_9BACT|nr:MAG: hypothetical protein A2224_03550 [Candidatus Magasanikbacteria bacterium RIFOXYA2_FULL_40_20]OGH82054.1 MAG: hypothetical protein A2373_03400 [Candidatus Magasanikbacteria bacterium RIFOXYB1_FULL_40_15]OGH85069.1 MAG: hypothetical protein A2301_02595 [Candidatus Magasanikbacteria bacterium RIFOXYB2_FULL_40_13]OGH87672.1 MAG: hypothetical protein A2206_02425 [Candidatus Magasanikbacteria bacterium RIFOXYA1_FULL_40_8]OGH90251.1 MAG: hypothetical protein A2469_03575 [Candidatus Magasanikba